MAVIVSHLTVQLGKPMGTTSSNWSSETPNLHTPQALLVSRTSKITIIVQVRTRTCDVMKSQQSPTSCTTPADGSYIYNLNTIDSHFYILLSL